MRLTEQIRSGTAPFAAAGRRIADSLLALLRCPDCRGPLIANGPGTRCESCDTSFPGEYGVPVMYPKRQRDFLRDEEEVLRRLCGSDGPRRRVVKHVRDRLHRNEAPAGALRRLLWK